MAASSRNRGNVETAFDNYQADLRTIRTSVLGEEKGAAADAATRALQAGETQAGEVASKNAVKKQAFADACTSLQGLRSGLAEIAEKGSSAIDEVLNDSKKSPLIKVGEIVDIVEKAQLYGVHRAQQHITKIGEGISAILKAEGDPRTAEEFAKAHGLDFSVPQPQDKQALTQHFTDILKESPADPSGFGKPQTLKGSLSALQQSGDGEIAASAPPPQSHFEGNSLAKITGSGGADNSQVVSSAPRTPAQLPNATPAGGTLAGASAGPGTSALPGTQVTGGGSGIAGPAMGGGSSATNAATGGGGISSGLGQGGSGAMSTGAASGAQPLSPQSLAQSFNNGTQAGAPASATGEALSQSFSNASPVAQQPIAPSPPTSPSSGSHYVFDSPQSYSSDAGSTYTPPADTNSSMYTAPATSMAPPPSVGPTAMPSAPAGPLPTYGSDLRPPTPIAPSSMGPVAASPLSAPVSPSSGQGALGQPAVVKQQPTTPTAPVSSSGLAESAVAATATGAVAGAASQNSASQKRLQSLVDFVARQEPKLSWAVGDREDGTTILTTDLACGWIPPHIEIPSGVQLLKPARRRGSLEHLLGDATATASWTPGHYLPPEKDVEPISTSVRTRQVPDIDELNWELSQSTNWRDGLPRLAHTLAKAGAAGTGVLDSESDMLREHLASTAQKVLNTYPANVDAADVGNWQLLAAIDALLSKQQTNLKYHFAWFQVLSMAAHGGSR
jgi:Family of unknown function (DUF5631)/Family of unknown function (DUF5632)